MTRRGILEAIMPVIQSLISRYLTLCARCAVALHRPFIVAVTGSVGKTTTKDMIAEMLKESGKSVRGSAKSYNSVYGVPLSILGLESGVRNPFRWLRTLVLAPIRMILRLPEHLVLEVGLEHPGDIADIMSWLHPDVGVMTLLAERPVHGEHFSSSEDLYAEKFILLQAVTSGGVAVCNGKDKVQQARMHTLPTNVTIRQFNADDVFVADTGIHYDDDGRPVGTDVVLSLRGGDETFYIPDTVGNGAVQSLAAAVTASLAVDDGIPTNVLRRAIASRQPTPGRMRVLPGQKGSVVIDDSYNASPIAMKEALAVLSSVRGRKKIAVLGAMAQLGKEEQEAHIEIGETASSIADRVVVVDNAPYGNQDNVHYASSHDEAIAYCLEQAGAGSVFLCKGSQISRVERVVVGLLANQCDPSAVLVRQEPHWGAKSANN